MLRRHSNIQGTRRALGHSKERGGYSGTQTPGYMEGTQALGHLEGTQVLKALEYSGTYGTQALGHQGNQGTRVLGNSRQFIQQTPISLYEVSMGSVSIEKEEKFEKFLNFATMTFCLLIRHCTCLSFFVCKTEWLKWVELSEEENA